MLTRPIIPHHVIRLLIVVVAEQRENFISSLAFVKRSNQRLHNRRGAIVRARIGPRLEVMRHRNMPVTNLRRFVVVEIQVRAQLNFLKPIEIKPEIDRRAVCRIAANNDQRLDFADVDVTYEFAQRLSLID